MRRVCALWALLPFRVTAQQPTTRPQPSRTEILAAGRDVTDAAEKARRWKAEWDPFYPGGAKGNAYTLIRLAPVRLEVVSVSRGIDGDARTWRPLTIEFQ